MKPLSLPKTCLLRKPWQYQHVYRNGKRIRGRNFSLIFIRNGKGINRLGISVHGVRSAVKRNRIKRIIREFFRLNRNFMEPDFDIVFAVRNGFEPDSPQEIERMMKNLLGKGRPAGRTVKNDTV